MDSGIKAAVVTVSTRSSRGERADSSGPALRALVEKSGGVVSHYRVVPDRRDKIAEVLVDLCGSEADIVFTLGGTGLAPSDVTPDATADIIEYLVPGIAEAIRAESTARTKRAMLSRGIAGVRGSTLVINFPGSERAAAECFQVVAPVLDHAVELLRNTVIDCARPAESKQEKHGG
jgi:molybdenum cofactor synthesis domain-containing protein